MLNKIMPALKQHLVDSTAILVITTPILATLETMVLGMDNEVSSHARLLGVAVSYVGTGSLFSLSRDYFRKLAKVNSETKERVQQAYDLAYTAAFNLAISPPFYYAAGVRDLKQIIAGTAMSIGVGIVIGGSLGYTIDAYRDFTGIHKSKRIPNPLRNLNSKLKICIAGALTVLSLSTTAGIYKLNNYKQTSSIYQKIEAKI